jgi:dTMP kinase
VIRRAAVITSKALLPQVRTGNRLNSKGFFITLEGIDGAGKTIQVGRLVRYLRARGHKVRATREPGGTVIGEKIRAILMSQRSDLSPLAELVLFYAARAQHLEEVIRPALERGELVVSDRFNDCSFVYQGYARGLGSRKVRQLDMAICGETQPDLTLVLDLDPRAALERALGRDRRSRAGSSRFEAAGLDFQKKARAGYRVLARREPHRVRLIRADRPADEVEAEIRQVVEDRLKNRSQKSGVRNQKR